MKKGLAGLFWGMRTPHQLVHGSGPTSSDFEFVFIWVHLWLIHFSTEWFRLRAGLKIQRRPASAQ
jgi:hypothetical protein